MSLTVDTNVLVYATNESDPRHAAARDVLERLARGPDLVWFFWPVLLGYLRIVTHPAILPRPSSPGMARDNVAALIGRPHVQVVGEGEGFWDMFVASAPAQLRGNDVPDAHLVALMRQNGVRRIYTLDRGFRRFHDIEVLDLPGRDTGARAHR